MAQLETIHEEIARSGTLHFIAAQRRGGLMADPEKYFQAYPSPVPFLLDEDRSVTRGYGVYVRMNLESFDIARPATFVVDRSGLVRYAFAGKNQTDRAPVEPLLDALRSAAR